MKNYTTNEYDAEIFITNYEETNDEILVNYADGSNKTVKNNENYRRVIKQIMNEQVLSDKTKEFRKIKRKTLIKSIISTCINSILIVITIFLMFATQLYIPSILILMVESIIETITSYKIIESYNFIRDIDKHKLFIKNENKINDLISTTKNTINNIKTENKTIITQQKKELLDINKIHKMKYIELKKLLEEAKQQSEEKQFVKEFKIES